VVLILELNCSSKKKNNGLIGIAEHNYVMVPLSKYPDAPKTGTHNMVEWEQRKSTWFAICSLENTRTVKTITLLNFCTV
jgi:hypothetical protein